MSGAQAKAAVIAGCIGVVAEVCLFCLLIHLFSQVDVLFFFPSPRYVFHSFVHSSILSPICLYGFLSS